MVIGFTAASIQALSPRLADLLAVLGAGRLRTLLAALAIEARLGLLVAIMAAFGAIVSEVGASIIVGGNLERSTRVLTTAIVTETSRGEVERALLLGLVLVGSLVFRESRPHCHSAAGTPVTDVTLEEVRVDRERRLVLDVRFARHARRPDDCLPRSKRFG